MTYIGKEKGRENIFLEVGVAFIDCNTIRFHVASRFWVNVLSSTVFRFDKITGIGWWSDFITAGVGHNGRDLRHSNSGFPLGNFEVLSKNELPIVILGERLSFFWSWFSFLSIFFCWRFKFLWQLIRLISSILFSWMYLGFLLFWWNFYLRYIRISIMITCKGIVIVLFFPWINFAFPEDLSFVFATMVFYHAFVIDNF